MYGRNGSNGRDGKTPTLLFSLYIYIREGKKETVVTVATVVILITPEYI